MYCLIKDGSIIHGPAVWNLQALMEGLYPHGFDRSQGDLYRMSDMQTPLMPMPDVEPLAALDLGEGCAILPVVTVEEETPEGQVLVGSETVILEDRVELRPVWADLPPPPSLMEVQAARCVEVDALRDSRLRLGYAFERDGSHVLQTRGEDDRLNWLGVLSASQALVMAGQGSITLSIRTESNDTLTIPAVELMALLLGALDHQSAIYAAAWVHKDAIKAIDEDAGGREAVQAYDITAGWPE